mmetsp:Transcript_7677/g.22724  ORF Transcript_7677/g.22724 Transcript_7677/m.22724 type:complete len:330 (-) Transcript_7677:15-1004(-)
MSTATISQLPNEMKAEVPAVQDAIEGDIGSLRKRQRRPKSAAMHAASKIDLSAEEQRRRSHQRERQKLALRLKAAGRPYMRQKQKDSVALHVVSAGKGKPDKRKPDSHSAESAIGSIHTAGRVDSGARPDHVVQVIIVPIFWLKREEEMAAVLEAAMRVQRFLAAAGVDCGCDTTVPMSPGQKFKHWEMQGVSVRVELGPRETERGTCILAVSSTPGQVAAKRTLEAGQELLDAVRQELPGSVTATVKVADFRSGKLLSSDPTVAKAGATLACTSSTLDVATLPYALVPAGGDDLDDFPSGQVLPYSPTHLILLHRGAILALPFGCLQP